MKDLARAALAMDGTLNGIDPGRMAATRHEFRSAVLIGQTQTAARAGPLMRNRHALAAGTATARTTTCRSPLTAGHLR